MHTHIHIIHTYIIYVYTVYNLLEPFHHMSPKYLRSNLTRKFFILADVFPIKNLISEGIFQSAMVDWRAQPPMQSNA